MNQQEIAALTRLLSRAARKGASAFSAIRLMVTATRAINQRGDKTVGKNLLAVVMPSDVAAAPSVQVLIGGGAGMYIGDGDPDFKNSLNIFSAYFPDGQSYGTIYAPNLAGKGRAVTDVHAGRLNPDPPFSFQRLPTESFRTRNTQWTSCAKSSSAIPRNIG
jgi:hypothetical protein